MCRAPRTVSQRRPRAARTAALAAAAATVCAVTSAASGFVTPARPGHFSSARSHNGPANGRGDSNRIKRNFFFFSEAGSEEDFRKQEKIALDKLKYPPHLMWKWSEDGDRLWEEYPGVRNPISTFWGIIQPAASIAFLTLGASVGLGFNIVDITPFTKTIFWFLRPTSNMIWWPQGFTMSFYGFFGFILFAPLQWWGLVRNEGVGVAEFNRTTRKFTIIRNEEMVEDLDFDEIEKVIVTWSDEQFGERDIYLLTTNDDRIKFQHPIDRSRLIVEKKASELANFLDKDLVILDGSESII